MMATLRRFLLHLLLPVAHMIGRLNTGSSDGNVTRRLAPRHDELLKLGLKPGDIFVTRTKWRPTNILIPGYWSHAGMYVGNDTVVHALAPVVVETALQDFMSCVNSMAVMRTQLPEPTAEKAAAEMRSYVGLPYDYMFEPTTKALYCSEAIAQAYWAVANDWTFEARERMGVITVTPQDLYDARRCLDLIWDSRA